jgi:hypothetical protein
MSNFPSDNVEDVGEIDDTIADMIAHKEKKLGRKLTQDELEETVADLTPEDQDDYDAEDNL